MQIEAQEQQGEAGGAGALTVSVDDFAALEDRIRRAVELVKSERQARVAAEERAVSAEAQVRLQEPLLEQLHNEINALRAERDSLQAERDGMRVERDSLHAERDQVRQRVERLLAQLDSLEL
jgi:chromosome segregation ATPase